MSGLIFPNLPGVKFTQRKTPKFNTGVQRALSGKTSRISYQPYPLYDWELVYEYLSDGHPLAPSRINYVPWSQDLTQWGLNPNGTGLPLVVLANNATAPDGSLTASRLILNVGAGTTGSDYALITVSSTLLPLGVAATVSLWLKTADGTTKTVSMAMGNLTVSFVVTGVWQRFVAPNPSVALTGSTVFLIYMYINGLGVTSRYADLFVWGAQVELGSYATSYIPTNGAPIATSDLKTLFGLFNQMLGQADTFLYQDPDFNTVANQQFATGNGTQTAWPLTATYQAGNSYPGPYGFAGLPELIQNTNGAPRIYTARYGAPELLRSASRTNLTIQSTLGTGWALGNITVTANAATAPDGAAAATQIQDNATNGPHYISPAGLVTITGGGRYTWSVWLKYVNHQYVAIIFDNNVSNGVSVTVDLVNGALSGVFLFGTAYATNADATITAYPNGWYRVSISGQLATADTGARTSIAFTQNFSPQSYPSYAGSGTDKVLCWGAQIEAGTLPTALIPTTTVAVTAPADYSLTSLSTAGAVNTFQQVTFAAAPLNNVALLWSGSFFYRCRFSEDKIDPDNFMYRLWALKKLAFEQSPV